MPFLHPVKPEERYQPPWKDWDYKANKKGLRHTVYSVNGDHYTGEWLDNLKHGKGTYRWKANGAIYDGDWRRGKRCGFGTYSVPKPDGTYHKQYSGGWKNDARHGYGTHFYSETEYYEGEWYADKRSGWGRMYYKDGSVYEGEWFDDERSGQGMYRLADDNRYEGQWKYDKKNGPGTFYYLDKGQIFEGVWKDGMPRCGEMKDYSRDVAPDATEYPIPKLELADPVLVLTEAEQALNFDED